MQFLTKKEIKALIFFQGFGIIGKNVKGETETVPNNKEYQAKRKSVKEHYSNRVLAAFTLGIFNFMLLFYLYRIAMGQLGIYLLTHHYAVYNILAICSLVVAAVLFILWKREDGTHPFYKENYRYFWIYFLVTAVAFALIRPTGVLLKSVSGWVKLYMGLNVVYVLASTIGYSIIGKKAVSKIKK